MMPSAEARVVSIDELYLSENTATRQPGKPATNTSAAGVLTACLVGRRVGFGSRWAIHPAQVPVSQAFIPTPEQVEAARRLVERMTVPLTRASVSASTRMAIWWIEPSLARHVECWHGLAARPRSLASLEDEQPVAPSRKKLSPESRA